MSSWLSNRLGLHWDLRGLAAPAGALVGGLLGGTGGAALGAGLMKTADNKLHGDSWGHALGQGALNAGIYGIGAGGLGQLKDAMSGGQAAGQVAGSFTPGSLAGSGGGDVLRDALAGTDAGSSGGGGIVSGLGSAARAGGSFLKNNPSMVSGALQGAGQIGTMGTENALRKAQVQSLDQQNTAAQYEMDAKKRRDAALAPLIAALQGQVQGQVNAGYQHPTPSNTPHYANGPYSYG